MLNILFIDNQLTANAVAGRTPPPADTEPGCGSPCGAIIGNGGGAAAAAANTEAPAATAAASSYSCSWTGEAVVAV